MMGEQEITMNYSNDKSDEENETHVFDATLVYVNESVIVDFMEESAVLSC